ncbi:MAG: hypothetical protein AB2552_20890 [Candidatus Thiodiazotropha endolucinida]
MEMIETTIYVAFRWLTPLLCLFLLSACSQGYYSFTRETRGWVVDANTGVPLQDVIVVGSWPNIASTYCGDHELATNHIYETTTDEHGEFRIPGCFMITTALFFHSDGGLRFYKKGYFPKKIDNDPLWNPTKGKAEMGYHGPGWVWQYNDSVVELEPITGLSEKELEKIEKSKNVAIVSDYSGIPASNCHWLRMPKMIMAIGHRRQESSTRVINRHKANMPLANYLVEQSLIEPENCHPDPVGFFMEYADETE